MKKRPNSPQAAKPSQKPTAQRASGDARATTPPPAFVAAVREVLMHPAVKAFVQRRAAYLSRGGK